jgi:hypothetical protein
VIKFRKMRWVGLVASMGDRTGADSVLVGKPEGKRPFGRPRCRLEDKINIDLHEGEWEAWTGLIWLRVGAGGGHLLMQ